ncbi:acyl-CoA dehydrogenase [Steroidobacter denitrificans]|uniref:Acyl-CoA dehydrogenase n=1 Tax=Steroidobacter denitrificans TaxID=465721 RepID=A0A127F7L0_STEDE|nr:acyl-CoA dehydrogenase family protein [Steroidobacter denitrificans]AMN45550.1 acyl-CoA dehydrogenase [Steroidobacter denitrificans]
MYVEYTPEQLDLRREFRAYLAGLMTLEERAQMRRSRESGETYRAVIRRMGQAGWLTPGWPVDYGGRALDPLAQKILLEELWLAEAPFPFVTVNTIGPALIRRGTEQQKRNFLPRIARGEIIFAIGYTEPGAGSDLASLKTRAERDGEHYVISGQKIFTSGAEGADYVWLAVRTDPQAPAHKGITIFVMDTRLPGFSVTPIYTVGDIRTNITFYEKVRVPADMMIGELHGGWQLITEQLNHERVGLAALAYGAMGCFDMTLEWARSTAAPEGARVIDRPWVQLVLAEAYAVLQANAMLGNRVAWEISQGSVRAELAGACKVFSTESYIKVLQLLLDVVGSAGVVKDGSPGAALQARLEREWRSCQINTFGGGATEVLRDMVAQMGLGLPRGR